MKKLGLLFFCLIWIVYNVVWGIEFSADIVSASKDGKVNGRMFVTENKIRSETEGTISITRLDKNVTWIIMPDEKMYMEQALDVSMISGASESVPGEVERKLVGNENISGRDALKYRIVYTSGKTQETMIQWLDSSSSIPLKVAAEDNSWSIEYKNLKIEPQSDSLFELPIGYTKFTMPNLGNMMDMMKEMQ